MEHDAAAATLDYARDGGWNLQRSFSCGTLSNAKILQVLAENPTFYAREFQSMRPINVAFPSPVLETPLFEEPQKTVKRISKKKDGEKESPSKRNSDGSEPKRQKKQRKPGVITEEGLNGEVAIVKKEQKNLDVVINGIVFDISTMPIPVCTCTGVAQQFYRWGNGGW